MCGGSWSFRVCGGLPRGVAVLGDRRPFRRNSAAWHTRAKGYSAQAVKPDVCRCAEIEKKHISSTTVSTNLVPSGAFRWRSRGAVARNDVMLRPVPEPHVVPCLQLVLIGRSELSKQWVPLASSLSDLTSKEATQSLAPHLLGCLGQATVDCVLTSVIWQNLSNKTTNQIWLRLPNK